MQQQQLPIKFVIISCHLIWLYAHGHLSGLSYKSILCPPFPKFWKKSIFVNAILQNMPTPIVHLPNLLIWTTARQETPWGIPCYTPHWTIMTWSIEMHHKESEFKRIKISRLMGSSPLDALVNLFIQLSVHCI